MKKSRAAADEYASKTEVVILIGLCRPHRLRGVPHGQQKVLVEGEITTTAITIFHEWR